MVGATCADRALDVIWETQTVFLAGVCKSGSCQAYQDRDIQQCEGDDGEPSVLMQGTWVQHNIVAEEGGAGDRGRGEFRDIRCDRKDVERKYTDICRLDVETVHGCRCPRKGGLIIDHVRKLYYRLR